MRAVLPVVSFQPEGHDKFMALMALMVGVNVEVTFLVKRTRWGQMDEPDHFWEVDVRRGEIVAVAEEYIALSPYGLPAQYTANPWTVAWSTLKMIEVLG